MCIDHWPRKEMRSRTSLQSANPYSECLMAPRSSPWIYDDRLPIPDEQSKQTQPHEYLDQTDSPDSSPFLRRQPREHGVLPTEEHAISRVCNPNHTSTRSTIKLIRHIRRHSCGVNHESMGSSLRTPYKMNQPHLYRLRATQPVTRYAAPLACQLDLSTRESYCGDLGG
jgi:hypothetical protein